MAQQQEEAQDPTQPGYQDAQGYTADDGIYYLNDGTGYMNPQTGEWFNMDGSPYGSAPEESSDPENLDYTQPGYQDSQGYTASD